MVIKKTLAQQAMRLLSLFPSSTYKINVSQKILTWDSILQPTEYGKSYSVRIEYKLGSAPEVYVTDPVFDKYQAKGLPHIYPSKKKYPKLCLYYPKDKEWKPSMFIAESIVLWISEWLFFYEIWLITKKWHADEVIHNPDTKKEENS